MRMHKCFRPCCFAIGLILSIGMGCDPDWPGTTESVEVHGTVTLDGKPLAEAKVIFVPTGPGCFACDGLRPISSGVTDAEGNFELRQSDGTPGAATGMNQVLVSKPTPTAQRSGYEQPELQLPQLASTLSSKTQISVSDRPQDILPDYLRTAELYQTKSDVVPRCYQQPGFLTYDIMPLPGIARPVLELRSVDPSHPAAVVSRDNMTK